MRPQFVCLSACVLAHRLLEKGTPTLSEYSEQNPDRRRLLARKWLFKSCWSLLFPQDPGAFNWISFENLIASEAGL